MVRSLLSGKSDNNCMSSREMLQVNSSKSNNNLLLCDPVRPDFHDLKKWIQSKFLIMIFSIIVRILPRNLIKSFPKLYKNK